MSHWNHRVIRQHVGSEQVGYEIQYGIHEVHYDEDGEPVGHTVDAIGIVGETYRETAEEWMRFARAFEKPILEYVEGEGYRETEARA